MKDSRRRRTYFCIIFSCIVCSLMSVENIYPDTNQTDKVSHREMASPFLCSPVNREYLWKKNQIEKKANSTLQNLRIDFRSMMGEERLNGLSLVCIASKYSRRLLLINPLSENLNCWNV